ncbi:MAG: helix-turn-helix domain-containing protein [Oligoflexia bacterium]|nr:helix-turn-helix domain-containing protein [Oligoflexia bacterium]
MMKFKNTIDVNNSQSIAYNDQTNRFFNNRIWRIKDVAGYLGVSAGHVYNLTSTMRIPHRKKGKLLYFIPSEINDWINEGNL